MNYTIIIPHRNIPILLQRCLDSIPRRYDVQIIVVDDNSSSTMVDFSHFPGEDREDVKVIYTKEGHGAGYARNCALKYACGKWILFADADDFFLPDFLEVLDRYKDTNYDMITFRADSVDSETLAPVESRQLLYSEISENMDLEILKYRNDVPWAKMISLNLIRKYQLRFDETPAGNDAMFSAYCDYYAQKMAACSDVIYCATVRCNSLQYGAVLENLLARVYVACRFNRFLKKIGRDDKFVYAYSRVKKCEEHFGKRGYYRALWIYLRKECIGNIINTFSDLVMGKIKRLSFIGPGKMK